MKRASNTVLLRNFIKQMENYLAFAKERKQTKINKKGNRAFRLICKAKKECLRMLVEKRFRRWNRGKACDIIVQCLQLWMLMHELCDRNSRESCVFAYKAWVTFANSKSGWQRQSAMAKPKPTKFKSHKTISE